MLENQRFSTRVRKAMRQGKITVSDLSRGSRVPRSHLSRIVGGQVDPQLGTCRRIARVLGKPLSELV